MTRLCWCLLCLALVGVPAAGADETKKEEPRKAVQPERRIQLPLSRAGAPLINDKEMEELKLSAEQKDKVQKIVKDYDAKQKDDVAAAQKALQDLRAGGAPDRAKIREATQKLREAMSGQGKVREDAEAKIKAVLDDGQKKKLEELVKNRPARPNVRPVQPGIRIRPGAGFKPGQAIPDNVKNGLDLTDDQKKKLEEIEKKLKEDLDKLLTPDQKKKIDQPQPNIRRQPRQPGQPRPVQPRQGQPRRVQPPKGA